MSSEWSALWDPNQVTLGDESVPMDWKVCVLQGAIGGDDDKSSALTGRIIAIFVIFFTSLAATTFPVFVQRAKRFHVPDMVYIALKNFGTGVIVTTAFIHLMDPAYTSIGANSCVGKIQHWTDYAWCPALILASAMGTFLVDTYCGFFSEHWYGVEHSHNHDQVADTLVARGTRSHQRAHSNAVVELKSRKYSDTWLEEEEEEELLATNGTKKSFAQQLKAREFHSQFSGFLVVELGIVLHSIFIGLALGSTNKWVTLFIVIIFHQVFEGLGIGARMSMIPFPKSKRFWPYLLALGYSLATPIAVGVGIGVRGSYAEDSLKQMRVQGICDALSSGVLIYTGFVELLARDWIFNPNITKSLTQLNVQLVFLLFGAGIMALLGKWA